MDIRDITLVVDYTGPDKTGNSVFVPEGAKGTIVGVDTQDTSQLFTVNTQGWLRQVGMYQTTPVNVSVGLTRDQWIVS